MINVIYIAQEKIGKPAPPLFPDGVPASCSTEIMSSFYYIEKRPLIAQL